MCNIYICSYACMYACMHVCMYACLYVCMYVCMYVCIYVCMYVCMHVCMYACMHMSCLHVCTHACTHERMYACMHVCMYACMHVCRYVCRYVCVYACMYVCLYVCVRVYVCITSWPHIEESLAVDSVDEEMGTLQHCYDIGFCILFLEPSNSQNFHEVRVSHIGWIAVSFGKDGCIISRLSSSIEVIDAVDARLSFHPLSSAHLSLDMDSTLPTSVKALNFKIFELFLTESSVIEDVWSKDGPSCPRKK